MDEAQNTYYELELMRRHISSMHANNPDMLEFLYPSNALYGWIRHYGGLIEDFGKWDQIPEKFLDHIASNFNFELIGLPYATLTERRKLIRDIIYIYRRKGTKAAIERLVTDLGFGYSWTDPPDLVFPFIANRNKTWYSEDNVILKYTTPFDDIVGWTAANTGSNWGIVSGKLVGTGDGTSNKDNVFYIPNSFGNTNLDIVDIEFKYEITTLDSSNETFMGFAVKWDDTTHWWRIGLRLNLGSDDIVIQNDEGGGLGTISIYDLDNNLTASQYKTGEHTLRIILLFVGTFSFLNTIAIDNRMLKFPAGLKGSFPAINYDNKGLIIDVNSTATFDDLIIKTVTRNSTAEIFDTTPAKLDYTLTLTGTPYKSANKIDFLKHILSNYSPFAVNIIIA